MAYTATSRQTIAKVQGKSAMTRNVKPTLVEGRKAILVQINWTTAPVIKTTVRKNFKLSVLAMDTRKWTVVQRAMMSLKAGQVIHYTQSAEHPGYYYITIVGESCTCMAGLYKQPCHHQTDAVEQKKARLYAEVERLTPGYISSKQQARQEREVRLAAKKAAIQQASDAAEAEIAALERTFENLVSVA